MSRLNQRGFCPRAKASWLAVALVASAGHSPAFAQATSGATPFELGAVTVTASRPAVGEVASEQISSVVSREDIRRYDRATVGDAVNLLSDITVSNGVRNEQTVYLRGYRPRPPFDRLQAPIPRKSLVTYADERRDANYHPCL